MLYIRLYLIILLLSINYIEEAVAQCPNKASFGNQVVDGIFNIIGLEASTQCTGRSVRVSTPPNVTNARYIYNYKSLKDTTTATSVLTHTYNQPGDYYIVQLGKVNGKLSVSCNSIRVYPLIKPPFSIVGAPCSKDVKLSINSTGLIYGQYIIDWGDGTPKQTVNPTQTPSHTYNNNGSYSIKVTGEGINGLIGCNAISDPIIYNASLAPPKLETALISVKDNKHIVISATTNAQIRPKEFIFVSQIDSIKSQKGSLIDSVSNPSKGSVCYQINYRDNCNRVATEAVNVCSIYLEDREESLNWSSISPFNNPVAGYIVEQLNSKGEILYSYNVQKATSWDIDQNTAEAESYYRVKAVGTTGQVSYSNIIKIINTVLIAVPDIFTPNGDTFNETLSVKTRFIQEGSIRIYDRWGNVIFASEDLKDAWQGLDTKGNYAPAGVYTYYIKALDVKSNHISKTGSIYLIR